MLVSVRYHNYSVPLYFLFFKVNYDIVPTRKYTNQTDLIIAGYIFFTNIFYKLSLHLDIISKLCMCLFTTIISIFILFLGVFRAIDKTVLKMDHYCPWVIKLCILIII